MIQLLGLMCMVTSPTPSDCTIIPWGATFDTVEACEQVGKAQLGSQTKWGIVVSYTCEPMGEDA